jgi:hypothetical protein
MRMPAFATVFTYARALKVREYLITYELNNN